ncbi:MAG: hypothetical protein C4K60_10460 [Ideonella sp. MAG2]|nr:MAG: hypothetical protein C4K60_10460 [Ideonella sp. MAG2]
MTDYDQLWTDIEALCVSVWPNLPNGGLELPAQPGDIVAAEAKMGITFPDDLRQAYLRHNGAIASSPSLLPYGLQWQCLATVCKNWDFLRISAGDDDPTYREIEEDAVQYGIDNQHRVLDRMNSPRRIYLSYESWRTVFVDLDPGPTGRTGQLVSANLGDPGCEWQAWSFSEALTLLVRAWREGRIFYDHQNGGWRHIETRQRVQSFCELDSGASKADACPWSS